MEDGVYKEIILELYRHPLNRGALSDYDFKEQDVSTSCGDDITLYIKFGGDGTVADVRHEGSGCAISQAAISLLSEELKGKTKENLKSITDEHMLELLGIPVSYMRMPCALLGLKTLRRGLIV